MFKKLIINNKLSLRIAFKLNYIEVILMSEFTKIPYVRKATKASLKLIGYKTLDSLKGADSEQMYQKECEIRGVHVDRCQLYMYRMIVYYANTKNPDSKELKWWYWKD